MGLGFWDWGLGGGRKGGKEGGVGEEGDGGMGVV